MGKTYIAKDDRYEGTCYRRAGRSGLMLPPLSLGFWHNFGQIGTLENMREMMHTAFDHGITSFDLANNYGPPYGEAERNCGRILAMDFKPYRDELIITSKAGFDMWPGPYGNWGSRKYLLASCDQSLERLGLDYVDIFYHHRPDPGTPLEETLEALLQIVRSGKAIYAGISNYNREQTEAAMKYARKIHLPLVVNQKKMSLLDQKTKREGTVEYCRKNGPGLVIFSPLAQGLLTGKYLKEVPEDSRLVRDGRYLHREDLTEEKRSVILALSKVAEERGQSIAEMSLAWLLHEEAVSSVIIGASRPEQILANLKAVEHTDFSEEELERIREITKGY
ncbi:MAG: aldo/keto reductase [Candidatus Weimeria sp.]|nr:aldo/keto reductase [Candidatus Weimeria sp.]